MTQAVEIPVLIANRHPADGQSADIVAAQSGRESGTAQAGGHRAWPSKLIKGTVCDMLLRINVLGEQRRHIALKLGRGCAVKSRDGGGSGEGRLRKQQRDHQEQRQNASAELRFVHRQNASLQKPETGNREFLTIL